MASVQDVAARDTAAPVPVTDFEAETDIVVVGGGGGGLPSALFSRWLGNEVIMLEKAPELGGTARKAAFWYWVPNNEPMRALGIKDEEEDCLRYMARLSRPQAYDPDSPTFGLSQWEYDLCQAIHESASPAAELLRDASRLVSDVIQGASIEERTDQGLIKEKIRVELRRFFRKRSGRRPLIVPVIMEV